jgi:hypothetical protein
VSAVIGALATLGSLQDHRPRIALRKGGPT